MSDADRLASAARRELAMSFEEPPPSRKENLNIPKREFNEKKKTRFQMFGESLVNKGIAISDWAAGYVNGATQRKYCAAYSRSWRRKIHAINE